MNILRRKPKQPAATTAAEASAMNSGDASPINDDVFEARPSARTASVQADGDTWQETLAVCEVSGEITTRSYYTNLRSGERIWDEPPSGASTVKQATEEMHRMAQIQLSEMQIAAGGVHDDNDDSGKQQKKKRFGFGNKKEKKKKAHQQKNRIQYKPTSFLRTKSAEPTRNEAMDPDIQAAIALSMADQSGVATSSFQQDNQYQEEDDEELAMAKALSLSEDLHAHQESKQEVDEDLLGLQTSPPQTYQKTAKVASMPPPSDSENVHVLATIPPSPPPPSSRSSQEADLLDLKPAAVTTTINDGALSHSLLNTKPPPKTNGQQQQHISSEFDSNPPPNANGQVDLLGLDSNNAAPPPPPPLEKTWPTHGEKEEHVLQKMTPDQGRGSGRLVGMTRRLSSKKKGLDDKAGVV